MPISQGRQKSKLDEKFFMTKFVNDMFATWGEGHTTHFDRQMAWGKTRKISWLSAFWPKRPTISLVDTPLFPLYRSFSIFNVWFDAARHTIVCFVTVLNEYLTADHSYTTKHLKKILLEVGSSHLYASFGTVCVHIGQLF